MPSAPSPSFQACYPRDPVLGYFLLPVLPFSRVTSSFVGPDSEDELIVGRPSPSITQERGCKTVQNFKGGSPLVRALGDKFWLHRALAHIPRSRRLTGACAGFPLTHARWLPVLICPVHSPRCEPARPSLGRLSTHVRVGGGSVALTAAHVSEPCLSFGLPLCAEERLLGWLVLHNFIPLIPPTPGSLLGAQPISSGAGGGGLL